MPSTIHNHVLWILHILVLSLEPWHPSFCHHLFTILQLYYMGHCKLKQNLCNESFTILLLFTMQGHTKHIKTHKDQLVFNPKPTCSPRLNDLMIWNPLKTLPQTLNKHGLGNMQNSKSLLRANIKINITKNGFCQTKEYLFHHGFPFKLKYTSTYTCNTNETHIDKGIEK